MSGNDKGKFSTDICQNVIEEALRSVEKADAGGADARKMPADAVPDTPAEEPLTDTERELKGLRAELALSQEKGRELMAKSQESHERMLRSAADLDNFRKRAQKEREEIQKFGSEKLLTDFLPVIDNLDRALEHSKASSDFGSLQQGVAMTRKLFEAALAKHGVKSFASVGQPFDPHLHEAMQHVETIDLPVNHVISELVSGYLLNERLLRPALVAVAKAPAPPEAEKAQAETEADSSQNPPPDSETEHQE